MDQLAAGDNVVFLANHQSEADPQVMSVCLEQAGFPEAASGITYVAGHKVTTDALAIPFSMGRNLICIHSKKHIDTDPETKPLKQRQNLNAMSDMLGMLKQGGTALWVAHSGGRDRRDLTTGKVPIAKFDSKTIDMFRLMGNKSKKPTHYYPLDSQVNRSNNYIVSSVAKLLNNFYLASSDENQGQYSMCVQ
jgi:glycerol-3-phosphate O-acyltransferase